MKHLNYFKPYASKAPWHEDQLTRAFLVLLRFIPLVQAAFIDMIRQIQHEKRSDHIIPPLSGLRGHSVDVKTQVSDIRDNTGTLLSIVMSDDRWTNDTIVEKSERRARYDGVIIYPPDWILVIENKPLVGNINPDQLKPALPASSNIIVHPVPINLSWRAVIEQISVLIQRNLLTGAEALLVDDFLSFVDDEFVYLNPYTNLSLCKGNDYLLKRRCNALMEALKIGTVGRHAGWKERILADSVIVKEIALSPNIQGDEWSIELEMYPGDIASQAKEFYSKVNNKTFLGLRESGWQLTPHLHFAFMSKHLLWSSTDLSIEEYIEYWQTKNNQQIRRPQFEDVFDELRDDNLINDEDRKELNTKFLETKRPTMNICPGIKMLYRWANKQASDLDMKGQFTIEVKTKIANAFKTWGATLPIVGKEK